MRSALRVAGLVCVLLAAYSLLPLRGERRWLGVTAGGLLLIASVPLVVRRLQLVRVSTTPVLEAVEAISLLLTMVVVGFASIYLQVSEVEGQFAGMETKVDALYFTVITLSTVGFGDVVPTGQTARVLVTAQIVVNLSFIAATVRVLARTAQDRRASAQGLDGGTATRKADESR